MGGRDLLHYRETTENSEDEVRRRDDRREEDGRRRSRRGRIARSGPWPVRRQKHGIGPITGPLRSDIIA